MGYVNESSSTNPQSHATSWVRDDGVTSGNRTMISSSATTKVQYGYRSGRITGSELAGLKLLDENGTWGQQANMLDALDRIQRATTESGIGGVERGQCHTRQYSVVSRPCIPTQGTTGPINGHYMTVHGAAQITGIQSAVRLAPLATNVAVSNAGKMMRSYRPTKPDFDLTRFIGELKDAPQFANRGNYIPSSLPDAGGSYLNFQFGVAPTWSDIQKGAEAIVNSDEIVRDFVLRSAQQTTRRGQIEIYNQTVSGESNTHAGVQSLSVGPLVVKQDLGGPSNAFPGPRYAYYLNTRRVQRMFSTFEYFVGDPYGYTTRMDGYLAEAKKVLGGGLTVPVAYQLTPFSWMVDWFYDIGGLLAYQQDVADNGIVQIRGGYVVETQYHGSVGILPTSTYTGGGEQMTYIEREQSRFAGSPYGMSPTWSLDNFQWAIVGALGLTKAKGLMP